MAIGNKTKNNGKLYFLRIKTKDAADKKCPPYISVVEKQAEKWVETQQVNFIEGQLSKIEIKTKEWQGDPYNAISLFFKDNAAKETYILDMRFNILSQGIFNSLFSLTSFDNVNISVYESKSGYPSASVTQNGERVSWKFNKEEIPAVEKAVVGKKTVVDTSKIEDFFLENLMELAARIRGGSGSSSEGLQSTEATSEVDSDEDVPF